MDHKTMAICPIIFTFLLEAHRRNLLPHHGKMLEFGESESQIRASDIIPMMVPEGPILSELLAEARAMESKPDHQFAAGRLIYRILFAPSTYQSIDLLPAADHRIKQDLNLPFDLGTRYDICINNGTTEHVFNQANCYKAIHDHTKAGGLMIHWTPCLGWINHGLYNVQPGFFHDLAAANGYEILSASLGTSKKLYNLTPQSIGEDVLEANPDLRNALACVILRKTSDNAFKFPQQGFYAHLN
jgi:hypothetical protein